VSIRSLFVSTPHFSGGCGRVELILWCGGSDGRRIGFGSGSDLSEEPAFQDVEPVTLDFVSFLIVLPGPPHWVSDWLASATNAR
jgi:hypothetical protein